MAGESLDRAIAVAEPSSSACSASSRRRPGGTEPTRARAPGDHGDHRHANGPPALFSERGYGAVRTRRDDRDVADPRRVARRVLLTPPDPQGRQLNLGSGLGTRLTGLSSLLQSRQALAQRVGRGQASHKWLVRQQKMGCRAWIIGVFVVRLPPWAPGGCLCDSLTRKQQRPRGVRGNATAARR
jgi:hypothetical protein